MDVIYRQSLAGKRLAAMVGEHGQKARLEFGNPAEMRFGAPR